MFTYKAFISNFEKIIAKQDRTVAALNVFCYISCIEAAMSLSVIVSGDFFFP